jgi:hypothetical protein
MNQNLTGQWQGWNRTVGKKKIILLQIILPLKSNGLAAM